MLIKALFLQLAVIVLLDMFHNLKLVSTMEKKYHSDLYFDRETDAFHVLVCLRINPELTSIDSDRNKIERRICTGGATIGPSQCYCRTASQSIAVNFIAAAMQIENSSEVVLWYAPVRQYGAQV